MNILIPTDFTVASIKLAERSIKVIGEPVNITLFHAFQLPYHYQDLFRSPAPYSSLVTDSLRQACKQLKEDNSRLVGSINFGFMRGDTQPVFRNFIDANNIQLIVFPKDYVYTKVHRDSVDPSSFFRKCKLPLLQDLRAEKVPVVTEKEVAPKMAAAY